MEMFTDLFYFFVFILSIILIVTFFNIAARLKKIVVLLQKIVKTLNNDEPDTVEPKPKKVSFVDKIRNFESKF